MAIWPFDCSTSRRGGPLTGVRVVDMSRNAPGMFCSMVLADLGAEVISIVDPRREAERAAPTDGVPNIMDLRYPPEYDALFRSKQSLGLNLKHPEGLHLFKELATACDILITEMRPGKPEKLGIGHEELCRDNPRLVYCAITGFGQTGPLASAPGHDLTYLALAGALSLFRRSELRDVPPNIVADYAGGGMTAAMSIQAALYAREKTGLGQFIDLSMTDAVSYLMAEWTSAHFCGAPVPGDLASGDFPLYSVYRSADGREIAFASIEPVFFRNFAAAIGRDDIVALAEDRDAWPDLHRTMTIIFAERTLFEWTRLLADVEVAWSPVQTMDEMAVDPQLRARAMVVPVPTPAGEVAQVGIGPKFHGTPTGAIIAGAQAGTHTRAILRQLGLSDARIDELAREQAVLVPALAPPATRPE